MEVHIREFQMSSIADDKVVVCIGRRGSGKSWAIRELLSYHTSIPTGIVISPTEQANQFFGKMVPSLMIHDAYSPEVIEHLVNRQKAIVRQRETESVLGRGGEIDARAFAVLDDCNYDSSWIKDANIRYLFMNGRHIKVFFIITMQYSLGLPPNLRTNVDYTFIFREPNINNRKRLYENYAGVIPTFDAFCQILDQCTQNHDFLVIDNTCSTNELTDHIFWCKSKCPPPFRLCAPWLWELSNQVAARKTGAPDAPKLYDIEQFRKVKHKLTVVKKPP